MLNSADFQPVFRFSTLGSEYAYKTPSPVVMMTASDAPAWPVMVALLRFVPEMVGVPTPDELFLQQSLPDVFQPPGQLL